MTVQAPARPSQQKIESVNDAVRVLNDPDYFRWARVEADKYFIALIAKRFPNLVPDRSSVSNRS